MKFISCILFFLVICGSSLFAVPKTYNEVANNWKNYVNILTKKSKETGMLPYERQLNKALLAIMSPISNELEKNRKGSPMQKEAALQKTQQSVEMITILENELKRAENIRLLYAKIQKASEIKNLKAINHLQQKSIDIRKAQVDLSGLSKNYIDIYSKLDSEAQKVIDAQKKP